MGVMPGASSDQNGGLPVPLAITAKPAIGGHFKTGQRKQRSRTFIPARGLLAYRSAAI